MTAVEWFADKIDDIINDGLRERVELLKEEAKQMEIAQRNNLIDDIDFDLMMMEDYAHGDVGDAITKLRIKLGELIKR